MKINSKYNMKINSKQNLKINSKHNMKINYKYNILLKKLKIILNLLFIELHLDQYLFHQLANLELRDFFEAM